MTAPRPAARRRLRRGLVWAAALALTGILLAVLWTGSDYANTSLRAAGADSTQPPDADPPSDVEALWAADSAPSAPLAVQDGTVVVGDRHGLRGLDASSGDERWHYLRSTVLLCDWATEDGVVVAVFGSGDGCDEAVALDAGTGQRVWYRNLNFIDEISLAATNQLTVASTPTGLTALGTTYNGVRWRYDPPEDCRIADSRPGDVGVAVLVDCAGAMSLSLLDGFTGEAKWAGTLPPGPARILTAGGVVAVLSTDLTGALQVYDRDGALVVSLRDPVLVGAEGAEPTALLVGSRLAVFTGSALVAVDTAAGAVSWVAPATTGPTLSGAGLLVFDGRDFVEVDLDTGLAARRFPVSGPEPASGAALQRIGPLIVVVAADGVAVYG